MKLGPDPIDVHVGDRIRARRKLLGQSQDELAKALGITFQQIQKYERGANRISASMMFRAATAQGVSPDYYFAGLAQVDGPSLDPGDIAAVRWLLGSEAISIARSMVRLAPPFRDAVLRVARGLEGAEA
jgi:transcriptional regulator with XRE-family HTH domain